MTGPSNELGELDTFRQCDNLTNPLRRQRGRIGSELLPRSMSILSTNG